MLFASLLLKRPYLDVGASELNKFCKPRCTPASCINTAISIPKGILSENITTSLDFRRPDGVPVAKANVLEFSGETSATSTTYCLNSAIVKLAVLK